MYLWNAIILNYLSNINVRKEDKFIKKATRLNWEF